MRKFTEGLDRVTDLRGGVLADWISHEDAKRLTRQMDARGEGWKWERWGGDRTGWNGVAAYWPEGVPARAVPA